MGKGTRGGSWTKEHEERVGEVRGTEAVDAGQQRDQSASVNPGPVKEDRSRWVGIPSSVVEFSLEPTLAFVYICAQEMQCCITPFFRLNKPKHIVRLFICSFSPTSLIVFLVAATKCAMLLSEPLVDHRARSEMFRRI